MLTAVRGLATAHPWWMLALLVGLYALRRLVDHLHERTGVGLLGILTAVVESFFLLVVIFGGFLLLARPGRWLASRELAAWWDAAGRAVERALAALHLSLPALLDRLGARDDVVLQPRLDVPVAVAGDPRPARIRRTGLPAPLHLASTLLRYRPLPPAARLGTVRATLARSLIDEPSALGGRLAPRLAFYWYYRAAMVEGE